MNHDPFDLEGIAVAEAREALSDRLAQDEEAADLKWLMSSVRGRRVVWRSLTHAGVFRSSFNTNALAMSFAEGNRNYGLRTLALVMRHCPEHYGAMVKENTSDADDTAGKPSK